MRTKTNDSGLELGQVLPLVALMMVAIVGMIALIIDGGSLMSNRRSAQAAADAAALAGARSLCSGDEAGAINTAHTYAITKNKATSSYEEIVENVVINGKSVKGIKVDTTFSNPSFFAGIFGDPTLDSTATATAGCLSISKARVLPIAWSCKKPANESSDSEDCVVHMLTVEEWEALKGASGSITLRHGATVDLPFKPSETFIPDYIYVVMDSTKLPNDVSDVCAAPCAPGAICPTPLTLIDCDLNNDGINDILAQGDRSWLDLDNKLSDASTDTGNGASTLKNWITDPSTVPPLVTHSWLGGQTGVAGSVFRTVDSVKENVFKIPVFNYICPFNDLPENHPECTAGAHSGDPTNPVDVLTKKSPGATNYFHIGGFAALYITCVDDGGGPNKCPGAVAFIEANGWKVKTTHLKTIEGYFIDNYNFDEGEPTTGGLDVGIHTISLTE